MYLRAAGARKPNCEKSPRPSSAIQASEPTNIPVCAKYKTFHGVTANVSRPIIRTANAENTPSMSMTDTNKPIAARIGNTATGGNEVPFSLLAGNENRIGQIDNDGDRKITWRLMQLDG
jgi:hypothetical protein